MEDLLHIAMESYGQAMRSTAQYAIEMDPVETSEFREHLRSLQKQIASAVAAEDWKAVETSFDGELRDYRDKAVGQLERLHQEIKATSEAVRLFAESVAAIDLDHEAQIKDAMGQLEALAGSADVEVLQTGIRSAAQAITGSIDVMRRRHQASIAELRDEIRVLHKQIDGERKAQFLDPATGVWNRRKLDSDIANLLERDQPFCILLVCVRNLPRLDQRYSRSVIEGALKALLQRFASMLEEGATIGRWDEQNFAALLAMEPAAAFGVSRLATKKLAGDYSVQENGHSQTVLLQAMAGVIDRSAGSDEASFQQKLLQMSQTLAQA
jgi:GGDEF domain-containing protein